MKLKPSSEAFAPIATLVPLFLLLTAVIAIALKLK